MHFLKLPKQSLKYKTFILFLVISFILIGTLLTFTVFIGISHDKFNRHMKNVDELNSLASQIYNTQKQLEIDIMHHRFDPNPSHVELIHEKSRQIDETVANMNKVPMSEAGVQIRNSYIQAREEVLASQEKLLSSIESESEAEVGEDFEKWINTVQKRNAAVEELKAHNLERAESFINLYNSFIDKFEWGMVVMAIGTVIGSYVLFRYINTMVVDPLVNLSESAFKMSEGSLTQFPEIMSNKELFNLSKSLNVMAQSIQANYDNLKTQIEEKELMIRRNKELEKRKDDFISMASHELRTPIAGLHMFTQIIEKKARESQDMCLLKYSTAMHTQLDRLSTLVDELLDISNIKVGRLELVKTNVDLSQVVIEVGDTLEQVISTHKLRIIVNKCPSVMADRARIGQVLVNFISNAVKYSPANTEIIIKTECIDGEIVVSVTDFGIGIAKEFQERIFERFFRVYDKNENTFPGLGIGLYISYVIIRKHGGRIWVDSMPGKGSTFYFALPVNS